jgi:hypothetical protein
LPNIIKENSKLKDFLLQWQKYYFMKIN